MDIREHVSSFFSTSHAPLSCICYDHRAQARCVVVAFRVCAIIRLKSCETREDGIVPIIT